MDIIGHVVFLLFVFMSFILGVLGDFIGVIFCACLYLLPNPVCSVFEVVEVPEFPVSVSQVHQASLFGACTSGMV